MPKRTGRSRDSAKLSRAAAHRLSLYLRVLAGPLTTISSGQLGRAVSVSDAQVRRDLASLGHFGQRGVGYDTAALAAAIRRTLGIDRTWRAVAVGVGNLARALLRYRGFREQGFEIVGLFDADPAKVGTIVEGLTVEPVARIPDRLPVLAAEIGVITVPADAAQGAVDLLGSAGIRGILNFAPGVLKLPSGVPLVGVDLTIQLEQLAFLIAASDARLNRSTRP